MDQHSELQDWLLGIVSAWEPEKTGDQKAGRRWRPALEGEWPEGDEQGLFSGENYKQEPLIG